MVRRLPSAAAALWRRDSGNLSSKCTISVDRGEQRGGHGKRQHIGYIALHLTEARCRSWAHPSR
jgi:hypothetical protein